MDDNSEYIPQDVDAALVTYEDEDRYDLNDEEGRPKETGGWVNSNPQPYEDEDMQLPGVDDLPLFASLEARKVDQDIKEKENKIEMLSDKVADMSQRLKIMKGHFKNVQQELDHTNELNVSKTAEMKTEKHLRQLTSRAVGQNRAETKKLQLDLEKVQDELSLVQSNIHKSNEKMDEFKMKMNWNQEELERWATAAKQKEDDTYALEKYTRADESKIRDTNLMIEHLTKEKMKKATILDNERLETLTKQIELDRIAEEFKKLHIDRQELVSRWQDAIGEIKKRYWEMIMVTVRFMLL